MKLVLDLKNKRLPDDLSQLLNLNSDINIRNTRNVTNKGMYIPRVNTKTFGINSLKYSAPLIWNSFLKIDISLNLINNSYSLGKFLRKHFLSLYESN